MKVLVIPDSFKDCLTSAQVATSIANGILKANHHLEVLCYPLADGGEGSLDVLCYILDLKKYPLQVTGPDGKSIPAWWAGNVEKQIAYIESAKASGIEHLSPEKRNPLLTTSYGTGQLIADAISKGYREIVLFLGGSATVDGGTGLLNALGTFFFDENGLEIAPPNNILSRYNHFTFGDANKKFPNLKFTLVTDVQNQLCGKTGAVYVFGPQKGLKPDDAEWLDARMTKWALELETISGRNLMSVEGMGAAGGMGLPIAAFWNVKFVGGFDFFNHLIGIEKLIANSDLVITGEGRIDEQTFMGKAPGVIAKLAKKYHKPVVAFCGVQSGTELYFDEIISLQEHAINNSIEEAPQLLEKLSYQLIERLDQLLSKP
jgi:glycerate kinase